MHRDNDEDTYVLANAAPVTGADGKQMAPIVVFSHLLRITNDLVDLSKIDQLLKRNIQAKA